jgi:Protein of unknown function (DUF1592)/Protein of unknown function (DUF1588)/Protein of unknown function (DUF1585)
MTPVRALLGVSLLGWLPAALAQSRAEGANPSGLPAAVKEYCVPCHNAKMAEAKVALDSLDAGRPWTDADIWERALRQLRARTMPPTFSARPDAKTYDLLVTALASDLDRGDPRKTAVPAQRVTGLQLAKRLASLLWSGAPDETLLKIAREGRLDDPAVLEAQVRRMLGDPKIAGLVGGFFDPWLGLDQLATMPADPVAFPEFDSGLREDMQRETELFLESQLREDRPAVELWTAGYTYLNERLARLYGIPNVAGPEFRRVSLQGTGRAGLLGQASYLTLTSALTKHRSVNEPSTSPATRAKWIRTHFLGVPAPNPIPGIGPLQKGILLSAQLRTLPDPSCNFCHSNFFPMGFALENFDELGRWRTEANDQEIDVSGTLADGTEFDGPAGLRQVLLERQDTFLTTITERLLDYALDGKPGIDEPTPAERMPAVRAILREAEKKRFTWAALLAGIAGGAR